MQSTMQALEGMGPLVSDEGVAFRVWAPHADSVEVIGDFTDWESRPARMEREHEAGFWYAHCPDARVGSEYKYRIVNGDQVLYRVDPYARVVTNSVGSGVVHGPHFDWACEDDFQPKPLNELVIYELHIGCFNGNPERMPGTFDQAIERLDHLRDLGVNAVEIMPIAEFAGDLSWGYNPAHPFAVESAYGGREGMQRFVKAAHERGLAVILDVVYNHFGPSDLSLWRFDGWSQNDKGGIYFYNDWRSETPWGDTRPDYGRPEVRQYIRDNALMWIDEFRVDGLRIDMTVFMRTVNGDPSSELPDGWSLAQWINSEVRARKPGAIMLAEDLRDNEWLTKSVEEDGAGFCAQWAACFVHPVREAVAELEDPLRSMNSVRDAILARFNGDAFQRVIYSESHDEVANGKQRVISEVSPDDPDAWPAQKRSTLAAVLVFTAPGIPMLFQGQEMLESGWFQDHKPLDWVLAEEYSGIVRLYRDLANLRLNREGLTRGLTGSHVEIVRCDEAANVIAFRRWYEGGPGDDTLVIVNFSNAGITNGVVGVPVGGRWSLRFNSDWKGYSEAFDDFRSVSAEAEEMECDGLPWRIPFSVAPYGAVVYSLE